MHVRINMQPIEEYIENNNLTRAEFCKRCDIALSTYYRIKNGKSVRLISLVKLINTTKISARLLVGW